MNQHNPSSSVLLSLEVTDEEHTLILMTRMMRLNEIACVIMLYNYLPDELPNKYIHVMNMINWHFQKFYELHTIKTIIEFISLHQTFKQMFEHYSVDEIILNYQRNKIAESEGVNELYLKPFTTECVQCNKPLKVSFSHRSKTVMSLERTFKACMSYNRIFN